MDTATVLEEAADLLLMRGRCRDSAYGSDGELCILAAIHNVTGTGFALTHPAWLALRERVGLDGPIHWNRVTEDDFEVIDTLRHLAKDIRNGAVPA